ncbi:hypothetical protein HUW46_09175 [Amycolatopsis sp. CA-230715]|nr:hypothetical protein HUW46_09175 [Amycolatopsis sp. CA-230715]
MLPEEPEPRARISQVITALPHVISLHDIELIGMVRAETGIGACRMCRKCWNGSAVEKLPPHRETCFVGRDLAGIGRASESRH